MAGPDLARVFSRVALWAGIGVGLINSFIMLVNRDHFAELFTRSPEVIAIVADVVSPTIASMHPSANSFLKLPLVCCVVSKISQAD